MKIKNIVKCALPSALLLSSGVFASTSSVLLSCPLASSLASVAPMLSTNQISKPYYWEAHNIYPGSITSTVVKTGDLNVPVTLTLMTSSGSPEAWIDETPDNKNANSSTMVSEFKKILSSGYTSLWYGAYISGTNPTMDCRYKLTPQTNDKYLSNGGTSFIGFVVTAGKSTKCEGASGGIKCTLTQ